jgi:hypothetical protein
MENNTWKVDIFIPYFKKQKIYYLLNISIRFMLISSNEVLNARNREMWANMTDTSNMCDKKEY